ncbi:MAG: hypothetical protein KIS66_16710 [Fimbriimonadaceae bacterium]|nr:hypothetical protein [Fimbriimonadaceae bacterium]
MLTERTKALIEALGQSPAEIRVHAEEANDTFAIVVGGSLVESTGSVVVRGAATAERLVECLAIVAQICLRRQERALRDLQTAFCPPTPGPNCGPGTSFPTAPTATPEGS